MDLYYATRFLDTGFILYLEVRSQRLLIVNEMEKARAEREATVDRVLSFNALPRSTTEGQVGRLVGMIDHLLAEARVDRILAPLTFPAAIAEELRARGYRFTYPPLPFFAARAIKDEAELAAIRAAQRVSDLLMATATDVLRHSVIRGGELFWNEEVLTA